MQDSGHDAHDSQRWYSRCARADAVTVSVSLYTDQANEAQRLGLGRVERGVRIALARLAWQAEAEKREAAGEADAGGLTSEDFPHLLPPPAKPVKQVRRKSSRVFSDAEREAARQRMYRMHAERRTTGSGV